MKSSLLIASFAALCFIATLALAQQAPPPASPAAPANQGQNAKTSAEDVLNDILNNRVENPLIEPARPIETPPAIGDMKLSGLAKPTINQDVRPNAAPVRLMREGQFLINRRARILPTEQGMTGWKVGFEAGDPSMLLMPCLELEAAEAIAKTQGDAATFIISGKIFVYHNTNYLLPTLIKQISRRSSP